MHKEIIEKEKYILRYIQKKGSYVGVEEKIKGWKISFWYFEFKVVLGEKFNGSI